MFKAAVITVSDRSFRGERPDTSGPLVVELLQTAGYDVRTTLVVPDVLRPPCGPIATNSRWISSLPPAARVSLLGT